MSTNDTQKNSGTKKTTTQKNNDLVLVLPLNFRPLESELLLLLLLPLQVWRLRGRCGVPLLPGPLRAESLPDSMFLDIVNLEHFCMVAFGSEC